MVRTSASLLGEVRRGEAVQVGDSWYRVGSAIGSGAAGEQVQRAAAPPSVTSDRDMSERNVYCDPFTADLLPLDGDFEGAEVSCLLCIEPCRTVQYRTVPYCSVVLRGSGAVSRVTVAQVNNKASLTKLRCTRAPRTGTGAART